MENREVEVPGGRLSGALALVTGAKQGIGRAIVERFVAEGATVLATDLVDETVLSSPFANLGPEGCYRRLDVACEDEWRSLREWIEQRFGRLDILVNNAGVFVSAAIDDPNADIAAADREQAVNVLGVVAAVRAAAKHMPKGGRIITIGSCLASRVAFPGLGGYSASKTR
jgi:3-oxoacyl-[acyl-carrier protein] reductase